MEVLATLIHHKVKLPLCKFIFLIQIPLIGEISNHLSLLNSVKGIYTEIFLSPFFITFITPYIFKT